MTKLLIGLLGAGVIATGGYAAATGLDDRPGPHRLAPRCHEHRGHDDGRDLRPRRRPTISNDVSGPCDEAEHRNDPRCTGAASTPAPAPAPVVTTADDDGPDDISGPVRRGRAPQRPALHRRGAADDRAMTTTAATTTARATAPAPVAATTAPARTAARASPRQPQPSEENTTMKLILLSLIATARRGRLTRCGRAERHNRPDRPRDRGRLLDPALGQAEAGRRQVRSPERRRRRPRLLGQGRRQDLEDARHRRGGRRRRSPRS